MSNLYGVSSDFSLEITKKSLRVVREFYIGTSDYSSYVTKWPKIKRTWNEIKPKKATVELDNKSGAFNFFRADPSHLMDLCELRIGVQYDTGSKETIPIFTGTVGNLGFKSNQTISAALLDKTKALGERIVGTNDSPVDYTSSSYYPSDIMWNILTQYGGMSDVASNSNSDIDYDSFTDWASVFVEDSVRMKGIFTGQKLSTVVRKIGRLTGSSIIEEGGRITFNRFNFSSESPYTIPSTAVVNTTIDLDDENIINRQVVNADYNQSTSVYDTTVFDVDSNSIDTFGPREQVEEDSTVWYVGSVSALNLAQRLTQINSDPYENLQIECLLIPLARRVGDTVSITFPPLDLSSETYRLMGYTCDMEKNSMTIEADASQLLTFFILDDPYLGLLDETYNPLG